jgi:hypothetical protein
VTWVGRESVQHIRSLPKRKEQIGEVSKIKNDHADEERVFKTKIAY